MLNWLRKPMPREGTQHSGGAVGLEREADWQRAHRSSWRKELELCS